MSMTGSKKTGQVFNNAMRLFEVLGIRDNYYLNAHEYRYRRTIELLHAFVSKHHPEGGRESMLALEIGSSGIINTFCSKILGYGRVDITAFSNSDSPAIIETPQNGTGKIFNMNLEKHFIPSEDSVYSVVVICEVIEHLDADPMFLMNEINRVLVDGGLLFLTTPNSASANCLERILLGYSPHFFMKYEKCGSPYKHNFEYSKHELLDLLSCSGFGEIDCFAEDVFNQPQPSLANSILKAHSLPLHDRGDDLFCLCKKQSSPVKRYPESLYI